MHRAEAPEVISKEGGVSEQQIKDEMMRRLSGRVGPGTRIDVYLSEAVTVMFEVASEQLTKLATQAKNGN